MLNTDNYIKENSTSFRIKSVKVNLLTEADPDYVFFISAADEKTRENLNIGIELTAEGIIQSFGYRDKITQSDDESFSYEKEFDYNERQCDYNYISIREDDMEDETIMTSIKLTATPKQSEVSKINLTAYLYTLDLPERILVSYAIDVINDTSEN